MKKNCASSWLFTKIITRRTVNRTESNRSCLLLYLYSTKLYGTHITWRISSQSDKEEERWSCASQHSVTVSGTMLTKLEHVRQRDVKNAYTELYGNTTEISVADSGSQMEGRTGSAHKATNCTLWSRSRQGGKNQKTNCRGQTERCHHCAHLHRIHVL